MDTITKSSLTTLRRRVEEIMTSLSVQHPFEIQELKLLLEVIRYREHSTGTDFSGIRSPRKAIELCLAERGAPMSKQEILDRLLDGGFLKDPAVEKWLLNDNINLGVKKGYLVIVGGAPEGWGVLIDLPKSTPVPK